MKISTDSNTISLVPGKEAISGIRYIGEEKILSNSEKRNIRGKIRTFLGMAYFITLIYFLFVLLT